MKNKEMNFEKALSELETTVEKLETGGLGLNESLKLFEKGVKLARFLRSELEKAEKKVEILLKDEKGAVRGEPFSLDDEDASAETGMEGEEGGSEDAAPKPRPRSGKTKADDGSDELPF